MKCERASEMMSVQLDGRLESLEIISLEDHLAGCSACQAEWRSLQALDSLLASAPMVRPPVRMRVQVMARLERRDRARRAIIGGTALTLGTVALALLALAPALLGLLNATGIAPALVSGGPETIIQLLAFLGTAGRATLVLVEKFAIPLAFLGLCGLGFTLALNSLWIGAVRRLRTTC
ncbi:MAG: zf-HC2 domain-containing protein [Chloroflexota bacterium]|nr:zf-HC2 domain-containing protein [Chloroflexota bacterium]